MWQTDGLPYVYIGLRCFCINIALCIVRYNKNRRQQSMRIVAGRLWERGTVFAHTHTHTRTHFAPTIDQLARVTTDARHLAASQHQYHDVTCPCSYRSDILFLPFSFEGCWNVPSRWMQKARERTEGQRNCGSK